MKPSLISIPFARILALTVVAFLFCPTFFPPARPDELPSDSVGLIEGEAINVSGPMSIEVVHGQTKTLLRSGSDVRVKSGTASIELVEGGQITICGPAHLSVLKSGGSLTVALDSGTIRLHIEHAPAITIYTAQVQAQPLAIGDGAKDVLVGFETSGAMCVRANRGAVRLEQQLTGQSVLIPQAGDVLITEGQLERLNTSGGRCACELQQAKEAPPPQPEISTLATAEEVKKNSASSALKEPEISPEKPVTKEEPIYRVLMPPLVYDAKAKVQPEIDPRTIILVRRVRVRSALVFRGKVEGEALTAFAAPSPAAAPGPAKPAALPKPPAPANDSFFSRVLAFFRKLWSGVS